MSIIHVQNLTKIYRIVEKDPGIAGSFKALFRPRYKDILAIDRLHFSIDPGELVGYNGVHGADKSTTIKITPPGRIRRDVGTKAVVWHTHSQPVVGATSSLRSIRPANSWVRCGSARLVGAADRHGTGADQLPRAAVRIEALWGTGS